MWNQGESSQKWGTPSGTDRYSQCRFLMDNLNEWSLYWKREGWILVEWRHKRCVRHAIPWFLLWKDHDTGESWESWAYLHVISKVSLRIKSHREELVPCKEILTSVQQRFHHTFTTNCSRGAWNCNWGTHEQILCDLQGLWESIQRTHRQWCTQSHYKV